MAHHITQEQMKKCFKHAMEDRRGKDELCISWIKNEKSFSWFNKDILKQQMMIWRMMAKEGKLKIMEYNNKDTENDGKKLYHFVVQLYENDKIVDCGFCPYALLVLGIMVSGYTYSFTQKQNRDAIYKYVMKGIPQSS